MVSLFAPSLFYKEIDIIQWTSGGSKEDLAHQEFTQKCQQTNSLTKGTTKKQSRFIQASLAGVCGNRF